MGLLLLSPHVYSDDDIINEITQRINELLEKPLVASLKGDGSDDRPQQENDIMSKLVELGRLDMTPLIKAAENIKFTGDPRTTSSSEEAHREYRIRGRAINALGEIGDERAVDLLIKIMKDNRDALNDSAAIALRSFKGNERVFNALIDKLEHRIPLTEEANQYDEYYTQVFLSNLAILAWALGDRRAVPYLIKHLPTREQFGDRLEQVMKNADFRDLKFSIEELSKEKD